MTTTTDATPTATLVRDLPDVPAVNGTRKLWRFDPPLVDEYGHGGPHEYVVSSAVNHWAHETYLFPADETGEIVDFGELPGSYQGGTDHEAAIVRAGYEVAR